MPITVPIPMTARYRRRNGRTYRARRLVGQPAWRHPLLQAVRFTVVVVAGTAVVAVVVVAVGVRWLGI